MTPAKTLYNFFPAPKSGLQRSHHMYSFSRVPAFAEPVPLPTKRQKKAVIRQLLVPVLLIIAALLYQPVMGLLHPAEQIKDTTPDKNQLVVTYLDVGQGDATLISKGNFHMLKI